MFTKMALRAFLFMVLVSTAAASVTKKNCDEKLVDICFLMDSSGSINSETHWETMKTFVRRLADRFMISETGAHGSVVVFSDHTKHLEGYTKVILKLDNKLDAEEFGKKVSQIPYIGFRTRIDLAFNLVEKEIFVPANGARGRHVKKVVILITDGKQNPPKYDPVAASQKLYDEGVYIYAVAIGKDVDSRSLEFITRDPRRVFPAYDFESLDNDDFVKEVTTEALDCNSKHKEAIKPTPLTKKGEDCGCSQDKVNKLKDELIESFAEIAAKKMKNFCKKSCEQTEIENVFFGRPAALPIERGQKRSFSKASISLAMLRKQIRNENI